MFGDRGTGKSTAVRALAALLPPMKVVGGCRYGCDPADGQRLRRMRARCKAGGRPKTRLAPVPVVDLPLGATEDRVVGALDLERALTQGVKAFEPGPAGARAPRLPLHRRGQPARRPPGRPADRRRRFGRERRRARGPERAPPGALRAGGQRQSGGRRTAAATARPLRPVGGGAHAHRPGRARRGRAPARRLRARPRGLPGTLAGRRTSAPRRRIVAARASGSTTWPCPTPCSNARPSCASAWAPTACAANSR